MHDISLYLLDIIENSVRAEAGVIAVSIAVDRDGDALAVGIEDDGPGLPVTADQALDPFYTTKPGKKTGLGLSLFRQAVEAAGGALAVDGSPELGGVRVRASMPLGDVDRPPLGDVAATIATMALTNPQIEFRVDLRDGERSMMLSGPDVQGRYRDLVSFQEAVR